MPVIRFPDSLIVGVTVLSFLANYGVGNQGRLYNEVENISFKDSSVEKSYIRNAYTYPYTSRGLQEIFSENSLKLR